MVTFRDKHAAVGRIKPISHDKTTIKATSSSRSLSSLIRPDRKKIQIEILENGYLIFDVSTVIGDKVKITKTNALKLSEWITTTYEGRKKIK